MPSSTEDHQNRRRRHRSCLFSVHRRRGGLRWRSACHGKGCRVCSYASIWTLAIRRSAPAWRRYARLSGSGDVLAQCSSTDALRNIMLRLIGSLLPTFVLSTYARYRGNRDNCCLVSLKSFRAMASPGGIATASQTLLVVAKCAAGAASAGTRPLGQRCTGRSDTVVLLTYK